MPGLCPRRVVYYLRRLFREQDCLKLEGYNRSLEETSAVIGLNIASKYVVGDKRFVAI